MKSGCALNWTFETLEALFGHTSRTQRLIEALRLTITPEEFEIAFADDDVVRGRVVMKLLMPLFQKMTRDFLDVVAVHDIKNFIPHLLSFAPTSDRGEHQPDPRTDCMFLAVGGGQLLGQPFLRVAQLSWLSVVI